MGGREEGQAVGTTELIKSEYRGGSHWLCRVFEEESSDDKAEPDEREEASLWMNRGTQRPTRRNPLPARRDRTSVFTSRLSRRYRDPPLPCISSVQPFSTTAFNSRPSGTFFFSSPLLFLSLLIRAQISRKN